MTDSKNIGLNFVGGSLTTNTDRNPAFTVVEFDAEFMVPLNFKTYFYDIDQANLNNKLEWTLLHDFVEYYHLSDVSPNGMFDFASNMLNDEQLAIDFDWNKSRHKGNRPTKMSSDSRKNMFCDLISSEEFQEYKCLGETQ